ncbi:MAG TPA: response regulator, partial [Thermoanaerobaculia bacterium]|nr:response regulator [Thermoanaerobaculia bacterium]
MLVIDDDDNYRAYVLALTRRLGFVADAEPDGQAGLEHLACGAYDVVVVDQEMPRMMGTEVIAHIRADEALRGVYAVMLTGREDTETKIAALSAGFDDFLNKQSSELEIAAKLIAGRRIAARQRELQVALRDLYGIATRDELTGVFNRRFFIAEADRLLQTHMALSLVLFDLDGFKLINDTYGHLAGDRVLRDIG